MHAVGAETLFRPQFALVCIYSLATTLAAGTLLPVLPLYVRGPLDGGDVAVGLVMSGALLVGCARAARPRAPRRPPREAPPPARRAARVQLLRGAVLVRVRPRRALRAAGSRGSGGRGVHRRRGHDGERPRAGQPPWRGVQPVLAVRLGRSRARARDRRPRPSRDVVRHGMGGRDRPVALGHGAGRHPPRDEAGRQRVRGRRSRSSAATRRFPGR